MLFLAPVIHMLKYFADGLKDAAEPEPSFFLAGAGADLKFDLEPIFWVGSGPFFLASQKWNDLKMLTLPTVKYKNEQKFMILSKSIFFWDFSVFGTQSKFFEAFLH